jgi:hypothetical protein
MSRERNKLSREGHICTMAGYHRMINFQLNEEGIVYPILLKYYLQNILTLSFPFLKTAKRYLTLKRIDLTRSELLNKINR